MTKEDRNHAAANVNKAAKAAADARTGKTDRDLAAKAVLDNMAKLKALRLAREAAEPPRPAAVPRKARAKPGEPKKPGEKSPALADWLAGRQSGGHRT
jgi:hypothetical protein